MCREDDVSPLQAKHAVMLKQCYDALICIAGNEDTLGQVWRESCDLLRIFTKCPTPPPDTAVCGIKCAYFGLYWFPCMSALYVVIRWITV